MTIVESVGWVLLHFVWQGAVIALALAVAAGADRRRAGEAALCPLVRRIDADADRGGGDGCDDDDRRARLAAGRGGGRRDVRIDVTAGRRKARRPGRRRPRARRDRQPNVTPGGRERGARTTSALAPADRSPERCRGSFSAGCSGVAGSSPSGCSAAGGAPRALRLVGVSPVPDWCQAQLDRAFGAHASRAARWRSSRPSGLSVPVDAWVTEAGDRAARRGALRAEPCAARSHPRARARARPPPRLSREPRPGGDRDAALLPSGGLVGVPAGARDARALLRRSRRHRLPQPAGVCPRAARSRGAPGFHAARSRSERRTVPCSRAAAVCSRRRSGQRRHRAWRPA